jgi:hypothetical protein
MRIVAAILAALIISGFGSFASWYAPNYEPTPKRVFFGALLLLSVIGIVVTLMLYAAGAWAS